MSPLSHFRLRPRSPLLVALSLGAFAGGSAPPLAGVQNGAEAAADTLLVPVTITVEGAESAVGSLLLALFDDADRFTDEPYATAVLEIVEGGARWRVVVPAGEYAAAAIHDRNGNGELDKNFLGMPREPYGFSNDARGRMGAPSFESARFVVRADEVRVRVRVR